MLERTAAAKFAISVFYESFNDFDVYIEDTAEGYAKIFSSILKRAISDSVSIERVFPLGDRGVVVKAARHQLSTKSSRRSVYIVDGDLYLLAGERDELPENVVVLPRYCIENFLVSEEVLIDIMDEEHSTKELDTLAKQFDYAGWLKRAREPLTLLFKIFAAAHHLHSEIPTVSRGYKSVCLDGSGELSLKKAQDIYDDMERQLISEKGVEEVKRALAVIESRVQSDSCFVSTYVSAKDFVLPLLLVRVRSQLDTNAKNISLKIRMAKKCSLQPFEGVVQAIRQVIGVQDGARV